MTQNYKPISISLSPNIEKDDLALAKKLIWRPWRWKKGDSAKELEEAFAKYLGVKYAFCFNSGRSAMFAILKSLNLDFGSQVLLQAFTCNVAANPILWADLEPIYVDCDEDDFNISIADLKKKIKPKAKAVMVQHTFGMPADISSVQKICKQNDLILIEDCAHSLGAEYKKKRVGTFGKASFFSFSRDKIISSVYGGMAITNDEKIAVSLRREQMEFGYPSYFWIFQQLLHPIFLHYVILPIYRLLDLGKIFLVLSQYLHLMSKAVSKKEKQGKKPGYFPRRLPNALAMLAQNQFKKLEKFNDHRIQIAKIYYDGLGDTTFGLPKKFLARKNVFLRFSIKHKDAHIIIYDAWKNKNILVGDWYTSVIAPFDTNLKQLKYKSGSCPIAEKLAKKTLNLPTHINISEDDAKAIVEFLKKS